MDTKYKVIITVFLVLAMLYALQYILTFVSSEKSKDKLREHFEDPDAPATKEPENVKMAPEHDVYMDILNVIDDYMAENTDVVGEVKASIYTKLGEDAFAERVKGKSPETLKTIVTKEIKKIIEEASTKKEAPKTTAPTAEKFVDAKDTHDAKLSEMSSRLETIIDEIKAMKTDIDTMKKSSTAPSTMGSDAKAEKAVKPPVAMAPESKQIADKKEIRETFENFDSYSGFEKVRSFAMFS